MKLKNCLYCCCHEDNKEVKCKYKRHNFKISDKVADKYKRDIEYIKKENEDDRHIAACLGSAGYIYSDDREMLANFAYSIGDKDFYNLIKVLYKGI